MKKSSVSLRHIAIACGAVTIAACSSSGPDSGAGAGNRGNTQRSASLSVSLIDAPVDNVVAVNLQITGLSLKPAEGPAIDLPLSETPFEVDLLTLTDESPALLVDNALIEAGTYEWLRLEVNAERDGLTTDSNVETDIGEIAELFVPSSRVQLVGGFEVGANEAVEFIFDWNLREGLVHPPGLGGKDQTVYLLKPTIRVLGTNIFGRLSGTIELTTVTAPENDCGADDLVLDEGNAVYIFAGHDVVPDDFDEEMDVSPLTSVDASLSEDMTVYEYSTLLAEGDYTVAFTCQAGLDEAETNETGNADPMLDTVGFLDGTHNITIGGDDADIEVNF